MRIQIVKRPPETLEGLNMQLFEPLKTYDVGGSVLDLLIINGYAVVAEEPRRPMTISWSPSRRS